MSRRRKRSLPAEPREFVVDDLSHDGRGVAVDGEKRVFLHGALPGERVRARVTGRKRRYDEGQVLDVLEPSADRVDPPCPYFGTCGGCSLQHLDPVRQIEYKQNTLVQNLARIGKVTAAELWPPITGPVWGYRRKARLSVRFVRKKGRVLVGFREHYGRFVADMQACHVLDPRVAGQLVALAELIMTMDARVSIPQIEVACGDEVCALVFRHLEALGESDLVRLRDFAQTSGLAVMLQPGGPATIHCLEPDRVELSYSLPEFGLELAFGPSDFVQVNPDINRRMVERALQLLDVRAGDRVLDLFCGLGNFTLPLARLAAEAVGVEGDAGLVGIARDNAVRNGLDNARFHAADLSADPGSAPWLRGGYDKVLVDPPRSGAEFMLPHIAASGALKLVYVSCHPASLAHDSGILVHQLGFRLSGAGVMDMFPHTGHVESMALFERGAQERA
jgi:23S rRNA (uracil1939-C5)-methyltransferase